MWMSEQKVRLAIALVLCGAAFGCAADDKSSGPLSDGVELHVKALATCGDTDKKNPLADIGSLKLLVQDENGAPLTVAGKEGAFSFVGTQKRLEIGGIPAGPGRTITLLGYPHGSTSPGWFARKRGVKVVKNATLELDVTLMKLSGFTCLQKDSSPIVNVAFPTATNIDAGRVLITGGYAVSETVGTNLSLTSARDDAYIFNANTGELRDPVNSSQNRMNAARGGHRAIYLPKRSQVLIVGGAMQMTVPADLSGPPTWKVTAGVNVAFETLDLGKDSKGVPKEIFNMPKSTESIDKMVMPNLMPLADDYVVALGGAEWPASAAVNKQEYKHSDLFDPAAGDHGNFVDVAGALPLNSVRAGAAIAFVDTTEEGGSRYLIWGGGDSPTAVAEVFRESTQPGSGVFDDEYIVSGDILGKSGSLYFATLTPLGAGAQDQGRFLSVGGIRHDGTKWLAPDSDDVYLVTLHDVEGKTKKIDTKRLTGLGAGIYLHQANLTDDKHVLISGGFTSFDKPSTFSLAVYDVQAGTFSQPPGADKFVKRGAHAALRLNNDCVLMWDGVQKWADLDGKSQVVSDIYCADHLAK